MESVEYAANDCFACEMQIETSEQCSRVLIENRFTSKEQLIEFLRYHNAKQLVGVGPKMATVINEWWRAGVNET